MGIVGLGFMGRRYARFVHGIEGMRLAGVVEIDRALAERTVAEFGGQVFASVEEMAASAGIDGVMICTGGDSPAADIGRKFTNRTDPF